MMESILYKNYNLVTASELHDMDDNTYRFEMCNLLRLGLIRDASFYEWMILNFQEIMDRDDSALTYIISKVKIIMQFFEAKDPNGNKECKMLEYGDCMANALQDTLDKTYDYSELLALGIIAISHISYKREMLSWEEFYEIRDMFVPFNLPIALDKYDVEKTLDILNNNICNQNVYDSFVLLKKIGKAVFVNDIKEEELRAALTSLIVEWE